MHTKPFLQYADTRNQNQSASFLYKRRYSSSMNISKTITIEYRLGFIQSFSEHEIFVI